jgi:hypothetical protein
VDVVHFAFFSDLRVDPVTRLNEQCSVHFD